MSNLFLASRSVTNSPLFAQVMLEILASVRRVLQSDASCLVLFDGDAAQVAYADGPPTAVTIALQSPPVPIVAIPTFWHALTDNAPYLVMDTTSNPEWMQSPCSKWIQSSLGVPLEVGGKVVGLLTADSEQQDYFQPADLEKLRPYAEYASVALSHAHYTVALEAQVAARTEELQAAKAQVEAIFNHCRDAIVLVGDELQIIKNNDRYGQLFLGEVVDCQGRSLLEFLHPGEWEMLQAHIQSIGTQNDVRDLELRAYRHDGRVLDVELSISPIAGMGLVCTLRDVTEHKAHLRQLRFLASLQENVTEAVIATDLDFRIQSWNKAAEIIYGWSAAEAIGQTIMALLQTRYPEGATRDLAAQALLTHGHWAGEVVQLRKDGTPCSIWGSVTLLRDNQQRAYGAIAINQDISKLNAATASAAESKHFLAQVVEVAPDTIYIFDLVTYSNVYINRSVDTILGYSPDEIKAMGKQFVMMLLHPEDQAGFVQHAARVAAAHEDQLCVFTYRLRHKDGTWRWLESHDKIFRRNGVGEVTQVIGVVTDVTKHQQAVEALRKQHDFLQQVIDNVPNLISVKDRAGRFQLVNRHSAKIYDLTVASMVGKTDADLDPNPAEVAFFHQKDEEALASGRPIFIPEELVLGTYYQTTKIPLLNERGEADRLLIVSVDISERRKSEAALQQALQREQELNELKSRFITTISHEFRTPLTVILASAETLRVYRHRLTDEQADDRLTKIHHQVGQLKALMEDVGELARLQAHRTKFSPVAVSPDKLCKAIIADFQAGRPLFYVGDASLPELKLDERLIQRIITNLIANAIKFSLHAQPIIVSLAYEAETLILTVKDEGIGIPASDIQHLFQPFYRATNIGTISGTGLGLAIVKEAVELHGGTISVESQLGQGTTFTVRIPCG